MGVLVLGMHRSGTSALARVVNLLGFHVGDEGALVRPSAANPAGHWEVEALSQFNAELLVALDGTGSAPPAAAADELSALAGGEWGTRAKELIDESFAGRPWVWKDPRLCLLLPFWRRVLDEAPTVVATVRNPLEVADSLEVRSGLPTAYALALWERYQRRALLDGDEVPVLGIDAHQHVAHTTADEQRTTAFVVNHLGQVDDFFRQLAHERNLSRKDAKEDLRVEGCLRGKCSLKGEL
jgi:hypothetical protein